MAVTSKARLSFSGRFNETSFAAFMDRRARRLDLGTSVRTSSPELIVVDVTGQRDLIDAFEMACSLGPLDCLVLDTNQIQLDRQITGGSQE